MKKNTIPKVIHYCWFGNNPKPKIVEKCISSWKKMCPDYEIKEWNESNFNININDYVKSAYDKKKWAFVSDYARLWIIYNNGGIYLDTDVELIKPFESDIYDYNGFFCMEKTMINTGLGFLAKKGDKIIKKLLDSYKNIEFDDKMTCVLLNDSIFNSFFPHLSKISNKKVIDNYIIYSNEYFCPMDYETRILKITDNTIGIHWYGGSWFTKSRRIKEYIKILLNRVLGIEKATKLKNFIKRKR